MAKKELLVDLRIAQPGAPGLSTMPGHYYSVIFDGSTRQDEAYRHHRSLCQRTVGDYSTSCQDRHCCQVRCRHSAIAGINGKAVHGSPASRKANIGHDHRWCSNKQSSSPQPGSVYAADDQMDKGCCVPPKKPPFLAIHNIPLLDRITLAFRTRTIKDICADQDVCRMFKQSKKL